MKLNYQPSIKYVVKGTGLQYVEWKESLETMALKVTAVIYGKPFQFVIRYKDIIMSGLLNMD